MDYVTCLFQVKMLGSKRFKDTIFITLPANGESFFFPKSSYYTPEEILQKVIEAEKVNL